MATNRPNYLATLIRRVLQWLGSLISGKKKTSRTERSGSDGSTRPEPGVAAIVNHSSPPPPSIEAEHTSQQSGATPRETEARTVEASGEVAALTPDKGTGTPVQAPTETQPDTSSETEIELKEESGSPFRPPGQVRAEPSSGNYQKTLDATPPPLDGSNLVAPGTETPAEVESERRHDDGRKRPEDKAEDRKSAIVPPEERGGRPRVTVPPDKGQRRPTRGSSPTSRSRPEIVCWKRTREWVVGIEIPDDISQSSNLTVLQAGSSLSEDGARPGCYPLAKLNTGVKVQVFVGGDDRPIDIHFEHDGWLLFKLSGSGLELGRKVRQVSSGSYLAIVPDIWRRDEERAGSAPTTAEPVFLEGYQAHFFLIESASSCIAFRDELGQSIVIGSGGTQFHLVGHKIHDERGRIGPLFGGSPPRLGIMNGHWSDVTTIVVGQEGSGRQRWRKSFKPEGDQAEQELPHEVLERKAGWYFIRYYDSTGTLIDSLDFRFVAGLKGISVLTNDLVPSPDGHVASTVEVLHDAGYSVTQSGQECPGLRVERGSEKTILTIPPRADCDLTRWLIRPQNDHEQEVPLTILIERLWWALSTIDAEPSHWADKPIPLSPEGFAATSNMAFWLRFPKPRWVSVVSAGFRQEGSRSFRVMVTDNTVPIPLRDFSGAQELDDRAGEHEFKVWLQTEQRTHEATIAVLRAQEHGGALDLTTIPAHRLATVLTRLRRAARGPMRQLIKEVRRKYRREPRSRPARNEEFVKEGLCLIAILMEDTPHEHQVSSRWSDHWKMKADLARREFPHLVRQLRVRRKG